MARKKTAHHEPTTSAKHAQATAREADARIKHLLSALEAQLEERFERLFVRLIWRLGLGSQKDVRGLSQRIDRLERRVLVRRPIARLKAVPRKPPASSAGDGSSRSSDNSAA